MSDTMQVRRHAHIAPAQRTLRCHGNQTAPIDQTKSVCISETMRLPCRRSSSRGRNRIRQLLHYSQLPLNHPVKYNSYVNFITSVKTRSLRYSAIHILQTVST